MKVYLYAKSGHTVGLEAAKRCAAVANILKEFDPILCTSDFRAGAFAKDLLGVKKYVNVDVIRNLTNMMQRRDILLFDTPEANEQMKKDMNDFCSIAVDLNSDSTKIIVDTELYSEVENPNLEKTLFFGDDDYNNIFLEMTKESSKYDFNLLLGHYFFLGNEKVFNKHFSNVIDEDEYVETIQNSKYLLTGSLQSALESNSCGNKPVLLKRVDKEYDEELISKLNIPTISSNNLNEIIKAFEQIIGNYPQIKNFEIADLTMLYKDIKTKIEVYNSLINN